MCVLILYMVMCWYYIRQCVGLLWVCGRCINRESGMTKCCVIRMLRAILRTLNFVCEVSKICVGAEVMHHDMWQWHWCYGCIGNLWSVVLSVSGVILFTTSIMWGLILLNSIMQCMGVTSHYLTLICGCSGVMVCDRNNQELLVYIIKSVSTIWCYGCVVSR